MNRHLPPYGEWTEVRQRRFKGTSKTIAPEITTLFVSKLPTSMQKEEINEKFSRYAQVVDVYLTTKKDAGGNHFAFVRFGGVNKATEIIRQVKGIMLKDMRLEVNIDIFKRRMEGDK
ncbi:hypothetical protein L2E82_30771 [Cichorium intybus]|uniref:Uncharacterized protein n=1 Tax=Cichorium intybus TaxID=13427 RepID=A0ACB9D1R6_CICIN|nr:hypothetical protein L2E82_30771 [Cichorium intybus]